MEVDRIRIGIRRHTIMNRAAAGMHRTPLVLSARQNGNNAESESGIPRTPLVLSARQNGNNAEGASASCIICFDSFRPRTRVYAAFCGHVFCANCFIGCRSLNNSCGYCTLNFGPAANNFRLYFRFNSHTDDQDRSIICRLCLTELNDCSPTIALSCGDVFCTRCFHNITTNCLGCNREINRRDIALTLRLFFR